MDKLNNNLIKEAAQLIRATNRYGIITSLGSKKSRRGMLDANRDLINELLKENILFKYEIFYNGNLPYVMYIWNHTVFNGKNGYYERDWKLSEQQLINYHRYYLAHIRKDPIEIRKVLEDDLIYYGNKLSALKKKINNLYKIYKGACQNYHVVVKKMFGVFLNNGGLRRFASQFKTLALRMRVSIKTARKYFKLAINGGLISRDFVYIKTKYGMSLTNNIFTDPIRRQWQSDKVEPVVKYLNNRYFGQWIPSW